MPTQPVSLRTTFALHMASELNAPATIATASALADVILERSTVPASDVSAVMRLLAVMIANVSGGASGPLTADIASLLPRLGAHFDAQYLASDEVAP